MSSRNGTAWKRVFRNGFAPMLSTAGLLSMKRGLETDDPALVQNATVYPPGEQEPVCAACPLGYAGWKGNGLRTVAEVNRYFSQLCQAADECLGELAACADFLSWVDDTSPAVMRRQLLAEVNRAIVRRSRVA